MESSVPAIIQNIIAIFQAVANWFVGAVNSATEMFWSASGELTALGAIALFSLGFAIILLVLSYIKSWLQFR